MWRGEAPPPRPQPPASPRQETRGRCSWSCGRGHTHRAGCWGPDPRQQKPLDWQPRGWQSRQTKPGHVRASRGRCLLAEPAEWEPRQEVGGRRRCSGELGLRQRLGPPSRSSGDPGGLVWAPSPHQRPSLSCYSSDKADWDITAPHLHPEISGEVGEEDQDREKIQLERRKDKKEPEAPPLLP